MSGITIYIDPERTIEASELNIGEVILLSEEDVASGAETQIYGKNTCGTMVRDFTVRVEGDGAKNVQLAADAGGHSNVFADPGQSIFVTDYLRINEDFSFWARGIFSLEDREGDMPFNFVFEGVSLG